MDIAWDVLSESVYSDLRSCIFTTDNEFQLFRQLVVNSVMATDIVDQELGFARKRRWEAAFASSSVIKNDKAASRVDANRKATIVIEHLIQASDVAHT